MMADVDVVVIDSGVDVSDEAVRNAVICRWSYNENTDEIVDDNADDAIGHGTAVCRMILRHYPTATIVVIKAFDGDNPYISCGVLTKILQHIDDNISCLIVNMSFGVVSASDIKPMEEVCLSLSRKGVALVSAFSNTGAMAYPAALRCVIGVTRDDRCKSKDDYIIYDDEIIDVGAYGKYQRITQSSGIVRPAYGDSYACAHFSGILLSEIKKYNSLCEAFRSIGIKKSDSSVRESVGLYDTSFLKKYKNVAVFPVNKETHCLLRFYRLLPFKISAVFDYKYLGKVGARLSKFVDGLGEDIIIQDIDEAEKNDFDAIVIGHTRNLIGFDTLALISKMLRKGKSVYAFDKFSTEVFEADINKYNTFFCPAMTLKNASLYMRRKLFRIGKPIVGVFGTGSKQGKFTLQLSLREWFIQKGYRVGQLGTEPSSLLFGMEGCFHFGYDSLLEMSDEQVLMYANGILNDIAVKYDPDIIITGGQSMILPEDIASLECVPLRQIAFICGTQPDAVMVCINYDDDLIYIKRSISFIEALVETTVIGLVMRPVKKAESIYSDRVALNETEIKQKKEEIFNYTGIQLFVLENEEDMVTLFQRTLELFTE